MAPPRHERKDARDINQNDREAIERIEQIIAQNRWSPVGSGRSADVTILDIWQGTDMHPWVIKHEERRTKEQDLLEMTLEKELALHEEAYRAVSAARAAAPDVPFAKIPKPLSVLRDEKNAWLLMDYLPGDNLFVHTLRMHLLSYETDDEERARINTMDKDALLASITSDTYINTLPARLVQELNEGEIDELDERHWKMIALGVNRLTRGPSVVLNNVQYQTLARTVEALHNAGIHHRDLHAGNVQILPDGSVGILDFGLALMSKGAKDGTGRYTVDVGHEFQERKVVLQVDEEIVKQWWDVARKIA